MSNKPLSIKDTKILKLKAEGKTSQQIGNVVGMKAQSVRKRLQNATMQDAIKAELIKQGITIAKTIKPIADALEASDDIYNKDGEYVGTKINHGARLAASDRASKLLGMDKAVTSDNNSSMTPEELQALANESDEVELTRLVFRKS